MAKVCIIIDDPITTITQLNENLGLNDVGHPHRDIVNLSNYLNRIVSGGVTNATVQVIVRDTDPVVVTSGVSSKTKTIKKG